MNRQRRLCMERLEARQVLAPLGAPWPNPDRVTLSFAPDGTQVGVYRSDLFAALGAHRSAAEWQTEILRGFAAWSAVADVDVGLMADSGRPFGVAGLAQGDPRFGDIRVAAFPQRNAVANVVPFLQMAGSWSGDVFLNSAMAAGLRSHDVDLYSVLLNEAGNALGLADNADPASVMYTDYHGQRSELATQDVATIQSLYGPRRGDNYEGFLGNESQVTATVLDGGVAIAAATSTDVTLSVDASIHSPGDVDYYFLPLAELGGRVTVRLLAAGRSLLVGQLDVLDLSGEIASAQAPDVLNNDAQVSFTTSRVVPGVYVRVASGDVDSFAVGRYRLEVTKRNGAADQPFPLVPPLPPPIPAGAPGDSLFDDEAGANETIATAHGLVTPFGYASQTRYEAIGTIGSAMDVDMFRLAIPPAEDRLGLIYLDTFGVRQLDFHTAVYDTAGRLLVSQVVEQANGRLAIQLEDIPAGEAIYIAISAAHPGQSGVGNYVLVVDLARDPGELIQLGSETIESLETVHRQPWFSSRTQLYRFELRAHGNLGAGRVRLDVTDERGLEVFSLVAAGGEAATGIIWLPAGSLTFSVRSDPELPLGSPIAYTIWGASLSDDTGPGLLDPTESILPGDADGSGVTDLADAAIVASSFGEFFDGLQDRADFDFDGDVDLADWMFLGENLGRALLPGSTSTSNSTGSATAGDTEWQAPSAIVAAARIRRSGLAARSRDTARSVDTVLSVEPAEILRTATPPSVSLRFRRLAAR